MKKQRSQRHRKRGRARVRAQEVRLSGLYEGQNNVQIGVVGPGSEVSINQPPVAGGGELLKCAAQVIESNTRSVIQALRINSEILRQALNRWSAKER